MNQDTTTSPHAAAAAANDLLAKRKRGRPRKDETLIQFHHVNLKPDSDLVGQEVSGMVEGSFEAGYFLNVKVKDSDKKLRGLVFKQGKVNPVTPENDVAPLAKMYTREEEIKNNNQTESLPNDDHPMKDAVTNDLEVSDSTRALSLMPNERNNGETVQKKEAIIEEKEEATRLEEFFPNQQNLVTLEKETEQQKSPGQSQTTRGFDLMAENPVCEGEKVPEELQLELGNKTISTGDNNSNNTMETTDPKSSVSKSGFIANLFEGEDKKVEEEEEEKAATQSVQ